jgi:hypothetical protein
LETSPVFAFRDLRQLAQEVAEPAVADNALVAHSAEQKLDDDRM